jgi:chromo domain-containing protein 1
VIAGSSYIKLGHRMADKRPQRLSDAACPPTYDPALDDIDLASTDASGTDDTKEFEVEEILASEQRDGETKYLVSWAGYEMHSCTWEPASHLTKGLLQMWEERQTEISKGERAAFDTGVFEKAKEDWAAGYAERHKRRNLERAARGLPTTRRSVDLEDGSSGSDGSEEGSNGRSSDDNSSSDEALEEDKIEEPPQKSVRRTAKASTEPAKPRFRQTTFTGAPRNPSTQRRPADSAPRVPPAVAQSRPAIFGPNPAQTAAPMRSRTAPVSTGYQGTARGPSNTLGNRTSVGQRAASSQHARSTTDVHVVSTTGVGSLGMMARKSAAPPRGKTRTAGTNIFQGGKTRKTRTRLEDNAIDPTKDAKQFRTPRIARISQKRSRDKEDKAPDATMLRSTLFDISKGQQINGKAAVSATEQNERKVETTTNIIPVEIPSDEEVPRPSVGKRPALNPPDQGLSISRKKSVQFAPADEDMFFASEPMEIDDSLEKATNVEISATLTSTPLSMVEAGHAGSIIRPPTPPRRGASSTSKGPPAAEYQLQHNQIKTSVDFAFAHKPGPIEVIVQLVLSESGDEGVAAVLQSGTIKFEHTCLAAVILSQLEMNRITLVGIGVLEGANSGQQELEVVAENLRVDSAGLCHIGLDYCFVVYPPNCDAWKVPSIGFVPLDPSEKALRYLVFRNEFNLTSHLMSHTSFAANRIDDTDKGMPDRALIMRQTLGWEYERLVYAFKAHRDAQHHFVLLFPESKVRVTLPSVVHWLQACNPKCRIYLGHQPGAWSTFRDVEKSMSTIGIVIVHQSLTSAIRRFAGFQDMIRNDFCNIWSLSESLEANPSFPSLTADTNVSVAGAMDFQRLLPHRSVLLLTPNFLASEPRQAYSLLKWFMNVWAGQSDYKLVTAHDVVDYMRELAFAAADERKKLLDSSKDSMLDPEISAAAQKLSQGDCDLRFRSWDCVAELADMRSRRAGAFGEHEENSPILFADEAIDSHDEQSLVNWFGLWSMMHMDQYRKFHVVGSEDKSKRGYTKCRVPRFSQGFGAGHGTTARDERPSDRPSQKEDLAPASMSQMNSIRFGSYSSSKLQNQLDSLARRRDPNSKWMLYNRPLSTDPCPPLPRPHNLHVDYFSVEEWWIFWKSRYGGPVNTVMGLFCTSKDDLEHESLTPEESRQTLAVERTPWVAIFRKVQGEHFDVIIWDPDAPDRCRLTERITEMELLPAQRQLVDYFSEKIPQLDRDSHLDAVWLGGFDPIHMDSVSRSKMDLALDFLEASTNSMHGLKQYLPIAAHHLQERGYCRVRSSARSQKAARNGAARNNSRKIAPKGDEMEVNLLSGSEDNQAKVVFQPPKGYAKYDGAASRCNNFFYEQAKAAAWDAREKKQSPELMIVKFRATLDWYEEQKVEGRTLNHLNIAAWPAIFRICRITDKLKGPNEKDGRVRDRSDSGSARADSQVSG